MQRRNRSIAQAAIGWRLCTAWLWALLLVACGGGGDSAEAPAAVLTSISVTLPAASLAAGQTQAAVAEARDQHGAAMPSARFTWGSSNPGVATVAGGVVTAVAAGSAGITASSGGVTSTAASLTVTAPVGRVVIDKPWAFLPGTGLTAQLTAQLLDAQGNTAAGAVTWTSSAPDKVSVDATGRLLGLAIGSAQVFAQAGALRSAPTLVFVAKPQAGALLVTDAQVVSVGPLSAPGEPYEVTLQGLAAPAPGTVVLAAETAPVAGKVLSARQGAAGLVLTLVVAPLYELLSSYDLDWAIDLRAFALEAAPSRYAASASVSASASASASAIANARPRALWVNPQHRPGRERGKAAQALEDNVLAPFKAFDCQASLKPEFVIPKVDLAPEIDLKLIIIDTPGYSKHALEGSASLSGSAGAALQAGFKASGSCEAAAQFKIPVGWYSLVVMPAVRIGLGMALEGEVLLVQGELGVKGKIGFNPQLGWECGGATAACQALGRLGEVNEFETKSEIPSANDMQAKVSGQFYLLAGLDASLFLGAASAKLLEARVGPKQSFDLAFEDDQAQRRAYASSYDLKLEGVVEPGAALAAAIKEVIDDDATSVRFKPEFSRDISESPKGSLSVSKTRVPVGGTVDFTVVLKDATLVYKPFGYNVARVDLYRKRTDEPAFVFWKSIDLIASNTARYAWKTTADDTGKYEFAAFVSTRIDTPLLEIEPDSIKAVEVSCFSAGPSGARGPGRARAQSAAAAAAAATTCMDAWSGTSSYIIKTPGRPEVNITATARINWTYAPALSGNGVTTYTASGTFDLAFHNPDGCTTTLSPSRFTIVQSEGMPARLSIFDNGLTPPTYGFGGAQLVNFTVTHTCPGEATKATEFKGFQAFYAFGNGPFTGQASLAGSSDDGAVATTWEFNRP